MYALKMWDQASAQWITIASSQPSAVDDAGNLATPCLTFTAHGASICNNTPGVVEINTPGARHAFDGTGYELPTGHRVEVRTQAGLPDPTEPPNLVSNSVVGATEGGIYWPPGTYEFAYTYTQTVDGRLRETRASPTFQVMSDPNLVFSLTCFAPEWLISQNPDGSRNWSGVRIYLVSYVGSATDVYPGLVLEIPPGTAPATVPLSNTTAAGSVQPPTTNDTGALTLRLLDPSGAELLTHDSTVATIYSAQDAVLQTPFAVLANTPARLLGQDPATGLPAFCPPPPLPPTALSTYVTPVSPTLPPSDATADTARCGAAHQMATRLTRLYNIVRAAVGAALDVGGPLVASAIVDIALDILTEGTMGTWIAANGESYRFMKIVLGGAINAVEQGLLPALDATATHGLVNAAYNALPAGQTPITVTQAAVDQWATNIGTNSAAFLGAADTTLRLLVPTIPLDQWQQEINTGSQYPSSDCA